MYETVGIREELTSGIEEIVKLSQSVYLMEDATRLSEQCVEVAALALRLRNVLGRPKRRRMTQVQYAD